VKYINTITERTHRHVNSVVRFVVDECISNGFVNGINAWICMNIDVLDENEGLLCVFLKWLHFEYRL
jgi:hypothetical protein